jgi:hypothetical protein
MYLRKKDNRRLQKKENDGLIFWTLYMININK